MTKYYTLTPTFLKIMFPFVSLFLLSQTGLANLSLSLSETAELIKENQYRVGVAPQLLLEGGGGSNVGVFFDLPVEEEMNARFIIGSGGGSGSVDFWTTASVKWVPFPDYQNQPAIGLRGAIIYARKAKENIKENFYALQITPIISKIVDTRWGKMNPYFGLPLTAIYNNTKNVMATQFIIGSEWLEREDFQLGAELDLNLSNTNTALTLHANFPFDANLGFRK